MSPVEADDRWDPEVQGPPPPDWRATVPAPHPPRRESVYERGAAACRAILREHGASEHGPHWVPRAGREDA